MALCCEEFFMFCGTSAMHGRTEFCDEVELSMVTSMEELGRSMNYGRTW